MIDTPSQPLHNNFQTASCPEDRIDPERLWDGSIGQSVTDISTTKRPASLDMSSHRLINGGLEKDSNGEMLTDERQLNIPLSRKRVRKYRKIKNPQSTWFCGGHFMTGGDSLISVSLALVVLFGLSGVWIGTTGVWLWLHGAEYGLAKGGGIAVVIIFA